MLYSNFTTEAVQYSIESKAKAIALYADNTNTVFI